MQKVFSIERIHVEGCVTGIHPSSLGVRVSDTQPSALTSAVTVGASWLWMNDCLVVRKLNPGTEVIDKHCYESTLLDCRSLFCCSCQIVLQPSSAPSNDALNIFFLRNVFFFLKVKSDLRVFWRKRNRLQILCRRAERKTNTALSLRVNSSV